MVSPLYVLIVDSSATDATRVVHELERLGRPLEVERVTTPAEMRAALQRRPWDVVISEWSVPTFSGRSALDLVKELQLDLPFIIVSSASGEEQAVDAIRAGAHDYVLKAKLDRLPPVVERELLERETRQARLEAKLARHEVERRMRRMIESAMVGIWFLGTEGKTSFMNRRMAQILGLTAEEAAHAAVTDFVDAEDRPSLALRLAQREPGIPGGYEHRFQRKDGSVGWGVFESSPLYDDQDRFEGVLVVMTDVTERRESQDAQREAELQRRLAEERGAAVVDAALDAIVGMDHAGAITEFNPAAEQTFGYKRTEVLGRALADVIIPPRLRTEHARGLARFLRTGESRILGKRIELSGMRRDGVEFPIELSVSAIGSRRTPSFVGFIRDISERSRVEKALVESVRVAALGADVGMALTAGATVREILQGCCEAIVRQLGASFARVWTLNAATDILELQASAGMYTHIDGPHARVPMGKLKIGLIAEERRPHLSNDVENDPRIGDAEWARREGMRAFAGHPLLVGGELVGVMAMFSRAPLTDVALTALGSVADAIAVRIRGKLVEQANAALEAQLRQSQKMEAVGRLAGGIAHDFNNLLSVVLSYSELLMEDLKEGDPIRDDIVEVHRAGVRAADLTRQLLMFSRKQVIAPKVLDLNGVLANLHKMLRRLVGEDVEWTSILGESIGHVRVDPGSIEQVIMNLVINARDAMPKGGKLTIETANVVLDDAFARSHLGAKPGAYVMLSVTDTGTGIDSATLSRVFEPFFTTKEKGKGTGLGLSTVFGIVQQSDGTVWVSSEPGIGTTFKVYLPRVDGVAEELRSQPHATAPCGSETILVVDDEDQVRDVVRGILRRHGYDVLAVRSAGEALLLCERNEGPIHLLLTDVVMPQM
ncbi:MAG: hybrid sensor histidine kinase/response regulator, partial [Myxococcaceae bacterium]|nr:hybrid sensor histidine kinase/response regulator [Myxococcaceae bacterium]